MGEPNPSIREVYRFGDFRLDLASRRLTRRGEPVALPPKAFELLQNLVRNADRAVTRTELLDSVWRDTVVEEGNLGWNMSVLRKALDDGDGRIIETVRGFGYRFAIPVETEAPPRPPVPLAADRQSAPPPPDGPTNAEPEPAPGAPVAEAAARHPGESRRSPWIALVAALSAGLVLLAFLAIRKSLDSPPQSPSVAPVLAGRPALAVLPFENLSSRADQSWLATALAEMLTGELSRDGRASTLPGESVARVTSGLGLRAGSGLAANTLARLKSDLGVDLVVVGNYLALGGAAGENLRFDFRLQSAADGRTLLTGSESGPIDGLFEIVARAGKSLRDALPAGAGRATEPAPELASLRAPTEALRAYAEGIDLRRRFQFSEARLRFERAIAAAPDFALAHAALADLLSELGRVRDARAESRRALAGQSVLSPAERLAVEAKNRELEGRWPESAELWRELAALDPTPIENQLAFARALSHAGQHDEARAVLAGLARRPPPAGTDPRIDMERGWVERYAQDFVAMRAAGVRALTAGRALPSEYVELEALSLVAWADLTLGNYDTGTEACLAGQEIARRLGHNRLLSRHTTLCAWIASNQGRGEEAIPEFERAARMGESEGNVIYQAGAEVAIGWQHAGAGRLAKAAGYADRALELAESVDDQERELNALELVSHLAYSRADLERAEEATVEALAKSRAINMVARIALHLGALGRIRLQRGDVPAALAAHEEVLKILPTLSASRIAARELDLARSRLEAGDAQGVIEICDRIAARFAGDDKPGWQPLLAATLRGRAALRLGRTDEGRAAAALLDRHADGLGGGAPASNLLAQRGELLAELGEAERAAAVFRALLDDPANRELELLRKTATLRLAEIGAAGSRGAAGAAELAAARRAAREAKLGLLLGEKL